MPLNVAILFSNLTVEPTGVKQRSCLTSEWGDLLDAVLEHRLGSSCRTGDVGEGRPGAGAVVLMHPVRGDRRTMLPRARMLARAGYSVLLFDFRGHGESDDGKMSGGHSERGDLQGAIDYVKERGIGLLGFSLGSER